MEQISQQCERIRPHRNTDLISIAVQYYKVLSNCVSLTLFNRPKIYSSKNSILQTERKFVKIQDQTNVKDKQNTKANQSYQYLIFPFFFAREGGGQGEDNQDI